MARFYSDENKQSFAIDFNDSRMNYVIRSGEKRI